MSPTAAAPPAQKRASALEDFAHLPDTAYVRVAVVAALFSISVATAWRWVREGRLPKPRKLGPQTTAWRVGDLRQILAAA